MADPWSGEGDTNYGLGPGVSPTNQNYAIGLASGDQPSTSTASEPKPSDDLLATTMAGVAITGLAGAGALALGVPLATTAAFVAITAAISIPFGELVSLAVQTGTGTGLLADANKKVGINSSGRPVLQNR